MTATCGSNIRNYYVVCGEHAIKLPRAEFLLLSRLARCPERVVTADDLWRHVWATNKAVNYHSLQVHICRLRSKVAPFSVGVETMVGVGYRLLPAKTSEGTQPS